MTDTRSYGSGPKWVPYRKTLEKFRAHAMVQIASTTAQQRQIDGWEKQGVISWLNARTGISRNTLYKIKAWFPTLESTGSPRGVWIKQEDYECLKDILMQLKDIEKRFTNVQQYFQSSLIVNLAMLRARRELRGESLQDALKEQIEMDENRQSDMEKVFNEALARAKYNDELDASDEVQLRACSRIREDR
jgi:hypothetical protein